MLVNKAIKVVFTVLSFLVLLVMAGCGTSKDKTEQISVVTDCFSAYDWVRVITEGVDDGVDVVLLNAKGQDMHSYQPSVADIAQIYSSDILIYIGGESDAWMDEILDDKEAAEVNVIRLFDCMQDLLVEEDLPGVTEEDVSEGHGHEHEEEEFDEHVWLSVANSISFVEAIAETLGKIDPDNEELYRSNSEAYVSKLKELSDDYNLFFENHSGSSIIICDRFPFRYMFEGQGMSYYAAFPGCSAETEASFATIIFLADKLKNNAVKSLFILENSSDQIANSVIANSGIDEKDARIYKLDSLQSINLKEAGADKNYYDVMKKNLETLKEAFGG